mmetsp:Transcript_23780/g.34691  ORF Transcript_23780/g.34691 Transcript_23780/m.34691 type:complete len:133 (+) Transcript_23780:88-486(+)
MDSANLSLPHQHAQIDVMRNGGVPSMKFDKLTSHPVEIIEHLAPKQKWKLHLKQLEQVYGRHAALHAQMQALILNKSQRLPTLESSFTGFATMFDTHSDLGVEDIYNDPFQNPDRNINLHAAMELKMDGHFL